MLTAAASLAVAFAASASGAPVVAPVSPIPPITVTVSAAPDVPARLISGMLAETDAIWRATGMRFLWQREDRQSNPPLGVTADTPCGRPSLRVMVGQETHSPRDSQFPLGWIVFDEPNTPEQEIYVSYTNVTSLLLQSSRVVGTVQNMPTLQRETLMGRAMGRTLAHELGHYLSASKVHAPRGLMMAVHTAAEFFGPDRERFSLAAAERQRIVARITSIYMASRG
jgi:hypothetical protein